MSLNETLEEFRKEMIKKIGILKWGEKKKTRN